jgi:Flp pilus assembly protein TadB
MTEPDPQLDPRKVRIGLIMISVVVAVAIVLLFVVDDPFGRAVMFAVAALGVIRAFLLVRALRRQG